MYTLSRSSLSGKLKCVGVYSTKEGALAARPIFGFDASKYQVCGPFVIDAIPTCALLDDSSPEQKLRDPPSHSKDKNTEHFDFFRDKHLARPTAELNVLKDLQ